MSTQLQALNPSYIIDKVSNKYRTNKCDELNTTHTGQTVTVCGWVNRRRDHGELIFIDLRDRDGLLQIVFDPKVNDESHQLAEQVRSEYVIKVSGNIRKRPEGMENPNITTGEIELVVKEAEILIAAVGRPEMVRGDWVKPGAVVIDVGVNAVDDPSSERGYRLVGDVAFDEVKEVASAITPVPGGVGPMTIAMLLRNTVDGAKRTVGMD